MHELVPHTNVTFNWFVRYNKKLILPSARRNAPVTWDQQTKSEERKGPRATATETRRCTTKEQHKACGWEDRQLQLMWPAREKCVQKPVGLWRRGRKSVLYRSLRAACGSAVALGPVRPHCLVASQHTDTLSSCPLFYFLSQILQNNGACSPQQQPKLTPRGNRPLFNNTLSQTEI